VFKDPARVMENIRVIGEYLEGRVKPGECGVIAFMDNKDGKNHTVYNGETWRLCTYIENTIAYETADNPGILQNAGYAFGRFQALLADMPIEWLSETIPGFHHTPGRLEQLFQAVREDPCGRVADVKRELLFFERNQALAGHLESLQERGELPLRVTHNDTKYNNILMDRTTGRPVCVIDLDTVMPGLSMHDYGDAIRFAANKGAEDEPDLNRVGLDMEAFQAFTKGFMAAAGSFLTETEKENMVLGAVTITIELAARFLADHIIGDHYFRIHRPNHNLDRARSQIKLAQDLLEKQDQLNAMVSDYLESSN
jgi:hypothetical protein